MLKRWWQNLVRRYFRRGVRGLPDPNYTPRELSEPVPEPESESGFPWSITRKLEAGIALDDREEWIVLMWQPWERLR
jgi:hypothetical protein